MPLVEQELLTLPEPLSSPPVFSGVRVTRSLVLCVCCVERCLSFCTFSFGHCVVCSSSTYGLFLHLWYLQSLLTYGWGEYSGWIVALMMFLLYMRTTELWISPFQNIRLCEVRIARLRRVFSNKKPCESGRFVSYLSITFRIYLPIIIHF